MHGYLIRYLDEIGETTVGIMRDFTECMFCEVFC